MIGDRTYRYNQHTFGTLQHKNLYSISFGYTETRKIVSAGSTTAVLAATNTSTSAQLIIAGLTNPDVPRVLTVTAGGTSAHIGASTVTITGTNVEGRTITDTFTFAAGSTSTVTGIRAFKTVVSVSIPAQLGTAGTFVVGTGNALGVNHRLFNQNTTVKVYSATAVGVGGYTNLTLQASPTVVANEDSIARNIVTPATTPNSTTFLIIAYSFDNWTLAPINDQPEYSTSTSTSSTSSSTSTTTATTTSTSTSSTSSSTSSTSSSTSSTSSSTSSTSTSTTTAP